MPEVLILRLDAPLMSFGGVRIDSWGPTQEFPTLSMLAGLLGNALGYEHHDAEPLGRLQARLRCAVRCDRPGALLSDFQTVDISKGFMQGPGWTTRGAPEGREGGQDTLDNLHIRNRDYWADAVYTVALALHPENESPDLAAIERALREPERPIFIGRKPCLPATPLLIERRRDESLVRALGAAPRISGERGGRGALRAWVPESERVEAPIRAIAVTDERDWVNDIVVGRRVVLQTTVDPPEASDAR
jgi:CRISPR system Cascade subunit CasD